MQEIKQLLPKEYTRDLELQSIVLGKVNKQNINAVLNYLKPITFCQVEELDHLKRINKHPTENDFLNIVLCLEKDKDNINQKEIQNIGVIEFQTIEVSKYPPYTKEQYEKFRVPWPITMKHKANDIITFKSNEITKIGELMKRAIDLAKFTKSQGNKFNACVLVDPAKGNQILMEATDETKGLIASIQHCVMRLADQWGKFCTKQNKVIVKIKKNRNESSFEEVKNSDDQAEEEKVKFEPEPPKRKASEDIQEYFQKGYYYCSNLDLYLVMEPCVMCSMALVHSRIRRVFYSLPYEGPGKGGLNEELQLNSLQGLNHKYQVFYNILTDYARKEMELTNNL